MATLATVEAACLWTSDTFFVRQASTIGRAPACINHSTLFSSLDRLNIQRRAWPLDSECWAACTRAFGSTLLLMSSGSRAARLASAEAALHLTADDSDLQDEPIFKATFLATLFRNPAGRVVLSL